MRINLLLKAINCSVILLFVTIKISGQFSKLYDFNGNDGRYPLSDLVNSGDTLFGTTGQGGTDWSGTVFRINNDGMNFKNFYNFKDTLGANPYSPLYIKGSSLYGTTRLGGKNYRGNLFKMDINGDNFRSLFNFVDSLGVCPESKLLFIGDTIFGIVGYGGKYNQGVLFRIEANGKNYKKLKEFDGSTIGNPFGSLLFLDNYLFGVSSNSIYKIKTDGSDFQLLKSFSVIDGIPAPSTSLLLINSILYGGACAGNTTSNIYKINPDGSDFEQLFIFPEANRVFPYYNLTLWNGMIFGISPSNNIIFRVNTDGTDFNVVYNFTEEDGTMPRSSLLEMNNFFYGTLLNGGLNGYGAIYKYNLISAVPENQAKRIVISDLACSEMKISWARGNGTDCAVFVREGKSETFPVENNTKYKANTVFGKGSQINNSGWYCVYNGTDSSVTITGLKPVTNYQVMVTEYNIALKGDEKYNIQKSIDNPFEQKTTKCSQFIFLDLLPIETYGDIGFDPEGSSSSGLKVRYSSDDLNVAAIENNFIKIIGSGETTITASQEGDLAYFPAENVSRTLKVNKALITVTTVDTMREVGKINPAFKLTYKGFVCSEDTTVLIQKPTASCIANINSPTGIYDIVISGGQAKNYSFKYINGKLTVYSATSVNENVINKVKIYPNPTYDYLFFEKDNLKTERIQIMDLSGNIVIDKMIIEDKIDVSILPAGLYFIRVNNNWYKFSKT